MNAFFERLEVRWIVIGAAIIFGAAFAADRLITAEIARDPEAGAFLERAFAAMNAQISDAEVQVIRNRVIGYLATPSIITIICVVLALPFWVGVLITRYAPSDWNATFAGLLASILIVIYLIGSFSLGAILVSAFVINETFAGGLIGKRLFKSRQREPVNSIDPQTPVC